VVQGNAGHLLDLEPLWLRRVEELLAGRTELTPADLENRGIDEANHDAAALPGLLDALRQARGVLIRRLRGRARRLSRGAHHRAAPAVRHLLPQYLTSPN